MIRKKILLFIVLIIIVIVAIRFFLFKSTQEGNVEIITSKSYLSGFEISEGNTQIKCVLTIENHSDEDVTISIKAHFTDDYKSGLVSDEDVIGKFDDTGEELIIIKAGETVEYKEISFFSKNNGCDTKNDRLLPSLSIEEID